MLGGLVTPADSMNTSLGMGCVFEEQAGVD